MMALDKYYEDFFDRRVSTKEPMEAPRPDDVVKIRDMVRKSTSDPGKWRSDAQYYVIYNVFHMLIAPLRDRYGPQFWGNQFPSASSPNVPEPFEDILRRDVRKLVEASEEDAKKRDTPYVSSTSVAIAVGRVINNLDTALLQLWGPPLQTNPVGGGP